MLIDEGLELLEESECLDLLGSGSIGRVGVSVGALPVIFPVNFVLADGTIVFRPVGWGTSGAFRARSSGLRVWSSNQARHGWRGGAMTLSVTNPALWVERLVVRPAVHVGADASIQEAAAAMRAANVSAVLVGRGDCIVTERDLTKAWVAGHGGDDAARVIATEHPMVVAHNMPITEAAAAMLNHEIRHLIVSMPDGSHGVISLRTVMAVLLQAVQPKLWLTSLRVMVEQPPESWLG